MVKLTAKRSVLYQGRIYGLGDALPAYDTKMVEAWLEAGTAEMSGVEDGREQFKDSEQATAQLARMKKDDLEKLADQLDVDISAAKNNAERAAMLSAVTAQAPVDENRGAQ